MIWASWRSASLITTWRFPSGRRACRWSSMPLAAAAGRETLPETGLRQRRHHQHHGSLVSDPVERHGTPDPVRSNAVESRFHYVRPPGSVVGDEDGDATGGEVRYVGGRGLGLG